MFSYIRALRPLSLRATYATSAKPLTFSTVLKQAKQQPSMKSATATPASVNTTQGVNEEIVRYIIHAKFSRNNTILTLTGVYRDLNYERRNADQSHNQHVLYHLQLPERVLTSLSTGMLGFRGMHRSEQEAGFQVAAKLFSIMEQKGYLNRPLEVKMTGFGKGDRGFQDALFGKEGFNVKNKIARVSNVTPLKFGGVKGPRPRRV
ncbi:unnamed protein product [Kuraishia capsulata CBS 1993]|uniref:Uncharacterized protein n=1 Tax=Kuraishia capsulata CBS 1993 TaxID=1382522 RepID=W6MV74_9ASCO|nr:uncharacterized protein KUCA_T00005800001 [Kuraishia capsulata CBS 1993]CDK29807.1 unnamed protein product [Kuraishia capsulata CBS 1993]